MLKLSLYHIIVLFSTFLHTLQTPSYIESFFSRLKQTFGFSFRNKSEINREKEMLLKCYLLNKFTEIGMAKFEIAS
uniref:hypothetical protein n=1 Tax=Wolbachia endosymbiont of Ctenocephalides felis wCfeT TaxID=2732593 RepID=UPI001FEC0633|nr:hypothetical protein [Wolbachia endosymbiont of Ctenocephalides felis wCfeT]